MPCSQEYLDESVEIALNDEGIKATKEQIKNISGSIYGDLDNYQSTYYSRDNIPNPLESELRDKELHHKKHVTDIETAHEKKIKDMEWTIQRLRNRIWELQENA